jgi:UDP-N-acetylmuramate--alanine ligase
MGNDILSDNRSGKYPEKIHFVGIGGIGMSALADVLIDRGVKVSGSDSAMNNLTRLLEAKGAKIAEGHRASNVPGDTDVVVRSTCIRNDNPEILEAESRGIKVISRGEMLKRMIEGFDVSIGVTGTHGKTTTSGLIAYIADQAGLDPTVLVGGEMERFGKNSRSGKGNTVVAEVDESDGYFRNIRLTHALVTNVEREHMEHYGSMRRLIDAYRLFIRRIAPEGVLVFNGDDKVLSSIAGEARAEKISFGFSAGNDAVCRVKEHKKRIEFDMYLKGKLLGTLCSPLVGSHNISNILGAATLCVRAGICPEMVVRAAELFPGVRRRFDTVGRVGSIRVIEDYAHHPTELRSVIRAARDFSEGRVFAIFQPHRYSRTFDLETEFAECFRGSDIFFLTDIYSAGEDPIEGSSIEGLFNAIDKSMFEDARMVKKENVPAVVSEMVRENDTILILGAGNLRDISGELTRSIRLRMEMICNGGHKNCEQP